MNGVGLTARVAGGDSVVSEPVFKVAGRRDGIEPGPDAWTVAAGGDGDWGFG